MSCLSLAATGPTAAHAGQLNHGGWSLVGAQQTLSKAQAIDIARQRTRGKVLSAELIQHNQRSFYKVKVLTEQGRVKTLHIDSGRRQPQNH